MKDRNKLVGELQEEHMDEMIRLAFKYEDTLVAQQIADSESDAPLTKEEQQLADRIMQAAWAKNELESKKEKAKRKRNSFSSFYSRLIPIAACLVLLLSLLTPVAIANSAFLRSKVMELLISIDESQKSAQLLFVENDNLSFDIPSEWEGNYYLSYIPSGYAISTYDTWESKYYEIEYTKTDGSLFRFVEITSGAGGSKGIEGAIVTYESINGRTAMICQSQNSDYIEINWSTDDRWLVLEAVGIEYEECLRIAESVKLIVIE